MTTVTVEGESISPEEFANTPGWLESHRRKQRRAIEKAEVSLENSTRHDGGAATSGAATRSSKLRGERGAGDRGSVRRPRAPQLPKEHVKVILRPRNGLNLQISSQALIRDAIIKEAGFTYAETTADIVRLNVTKNLIVISTPSMQRAATYDKLTSLCDGEKTYGLCAYITSPEDCAKGVIHNIPPADNDAAIMASLVCTQNPTILQARRLGTSKSAIILFEGNKVPHFVYYRGAEYRCFLHKKRHEVCSSCGKLGHRRDVCPFPMDPARPRTTCETCGALNPQEGHACELKCALCGKGHKTGDKRCRQRYEVPYLLKKRKWEKQRRSKNEGHSRSRSSSEDKSPLKSILKNSRDRSASFPRLPRQDSDESTNRRQSRSPTRSKSRSRSKGRGDKQEHRSRSKTPRRQPKGHRGLSKRAPGRNGVVTVSWASAASPNANNTTPRLDDTQAEIAKLKKMLETVMLENQALKAKIAETCAASMSPSPGILNKEVSVSINSVASVETDLETPTHTGKEMVVPDDSKPLAKRTANRKRAAAQSENTESVTVAKFEKSISEVRALITSFMDSVNKQLAALNTRMSTIETTTVAIKQHVGMGIGNVPPATSEQQRPPTPKGQSQPLLRTAILPSPYGPSESLE